MTTKINVIIVESHQHALEHYHATIRKQKLFHRSWQMIHFDAHPDLACPSPNIPAASCFVPRQTFVVSSSNQQEGSNLYELLDLSPSGIAEWILPLVLAANLRMVEWIRPEFSSQLPLGRHEMKVGAYDNSIKDYKSINSFLDLPQTAKVKTDLKLPYYLDDASVVPSNELVLARHLELHVTCLEEDNPMASLTELYKEEDGEEEEEWALDICLDYFSCLNPFLKDIDNADPKITETLLTIMKKAQCYTPSPELDQEQPEKSFRYLKSILSQILSSNGDLDDNDLSPLSSFYESIEEVATLISDLKRLIQKEEEEDDESKKVLSLVLKAIPNWSMPHARSSMNNNAILKSLAQVEEAMKSRDKNRRPFLISICRSAEDEFTPNADFIQEKVLEILHRVFCGSDCQKNCRLNIIKDYGDYEGSTLF